MPAPASPDPEFIFTPPHLLLSSLLHRAPSWPSRVFLHPSNVTRRWEPTDSHWLSSAGAAVTACSATPTSLLLGGGVFYASTRTEQGWSVRRRTCFGNGHGDALQSVWWCVRCHSHKQLTYCIGKYIIYFFFQESNISSWFPGTNFTIPTSILKYYIIKFTSICKKLQANVSKSHCLSGKYIGVGGNHSEWNVQTHF